MDNHFQLLLYHFLVSEALPVCRVSGNRRGAAAVWGLSPPHISPQLIPMNRICFLPVSRVEFYPVHFFDDQKTITRIDDVSGFIWR